MVKITIDGKEILVAENTNLSIEVTGDDSSI